MAESIAEYREALATSPLSAGLQNNLAWALVICPRDPLRDGAGALDLARRADRLTGGKNPAILHTLAAALAETGRFEEAVETAKKAVELAEDQSNPALARTLENEIRLYRNRQPLRGGARR
jgi:tetratricopeptide (TPR) repeat protein